MTVTHTPCGGKLRVNAGITQTLMSLGAHPNPEVIRLAWMLTDTYLAHTGESSNRPCSCPFKYLMATQQQSKSTAPPSDSSTRAMLLVASSATSASTAVIVSSSDSVPVATLSALHSNGRPPIQDSSALEIAYSTISPKVEQPQYPMHIKLNLIDQNPLASSLSTNGDLTSCESPYPMTPITPGGYSSSGGDLSKKQRHNLREQRRILRISNQFEILRNKLEAAGYSSSKKDKYSVLQATLEYISNLERNQINGVAPHHQVQHHLQHASSHSHGVVSHHLPSPCNDSNGRLSITAPSSSHVDSKGHVFMIDSMPSPVPALSIPGMQPQTSYPLEMDNMYANTANGTSAANALEIEGSAASYRDVFASSSMPSLLAKLDGTIVEANALFLELSCKNIDELRLHSLYTMCTAMDAPKMYNLVDKILSCEMASAQSKMMWHFSSAGDRKVFVSVSMIHDSMHRPANLHCSLLPLS
ncbi:pas pac sensor hybrid histidine kinase [Plasmopara halstedii]|uniref:Pas pac sensor hybrid histidine kinase n=1 Tax=Plasmopara halstedii TaxID=4781 RepID=A0A0P1ADG7_PLAHL|nr:pas pac sensor hybrid histidine kinase [Plasmopara halstedii]CEG38839.1 pas pac sensor hybrid histidine kinase [Plasmopara halstedii]|eukprot:XP_024575208.1 pas pac sensor hybrid histidine kinase [Plasmopara halstedii]